jgi:hypothetical protein
MEERNKVEREWIKLQALVDDEIPDTSFLWCADSNTLNITNDIFWKSKRIRELDPEDIVGKDSINIRFEIDESENSDNSTPDSSVSPNVPRNSVVPNNSTSHMPHRIYVHKIGGKGHITPEVQDVPENNVILEVEG